MFSAIFDLLLRQLITNFGWLYVLCLHLPLNFMQRKVNSIWRGIRFRLQLARKSHPRKVAAVQREVRRWNAVGRPTHQRMCTSADWQTCQRMCFTRPAYMRGMCHIHLDTLSDIIEINTSAQFVRVEPFVTMDQLLRALLPLGFTLPVVPELGDLTVGGLIHGCGIGSGSARHGLFQHICMAYEVVTTSGELLIAEKKGEHQSLFYGIPWSIGTLGFLVSATIQIQRCPRFVRLVYQPCLSANELCGRLQEEMQPRADNDFVEGIQFDRNQGMLLTGKFVDQIPRNEQRSLNTIGRWHTPFFHDHVRRLLTRHGTPKVEYIPSGDYFRRHWRSLFWEICSLLPIAGTMPFRWLFGWLLPPAVAIPKSQRIRRMLARRHLLQNYLVPVKGMAETLAMLGDKLQVYPLWVCPFILPAQPGMLRNRLGLKSIYVNIGIYGKVPAKARAGGDKEFVEKMAAIEGHVRNVHGFQMICADSQQTAAQFWEMFDATLYDWLRAKYDCKTALPNVYEKLCMANREL